ncbi:glutamine-hydrolyzing carbamoyl-phosphate synthase small subunit [Nakamurella flava]|uniref:Carbamoyl phosphate synthase small chain n=1 Tax=Nakamurella flava TaxID=2576308 RepID=A0A4U6QLU2_9ACTN|nr:glutamine-hydrolyzing carbamoyl-phosphate synthase small subunit [Nakamurella flava]TKV61540.1 glutamine-hydrolyzing carbamoyl-phosphate synthase small subunit [Nakamurella flava]
MTSTSPDGATTPTTPVPAVLVLEDGRVHRGTAFGATGTAFGEAVFTTGMTGYQETLTDPSYRRQIVVATAPQIGNTGWVAGSSRDRQTTALPEGVRADVPAGPQDPDDNESKAIWVAGFVVRDLAPRPSNWRATGTLSDEMAAQGVVGIAGVDTRALTRHLRTAGAMRCGIFSGSDVTDVETMVAAVKATDGMAGADLSGEVSTTERYTVPAAGEQKFTVAALDLGIKANTPRMLAARGITTHVLPATATIEDVRAVGADGVFLSNGPGDPATADAMVALTADVLEAGIPLFGICFGNQILGRALGLGTYKLKFGHRGINQPVQDRRTGQVLVSAHNHGFAVDAPRDGDFDTPYGPARVAFTCLNDDVVEGLECLDKPAFSVQFHPEAAAGPHDAGYLFDRFVELMDSNTPEGKNA